jgi:hypothetical protein
MPNVLQFKPPLCGICNKPVELDIAVTDQDGKPVHEECYVLKVRQEDAKKPPESRKTMGEDNVNPPLWLLPWVYNFGELHSRVSQLAQPPTVGPFLSVKSMQLMGYTAVRK